MRPLGSGPEIRAHLHRDVWVSIGDSDPFDDATQGVILKIMRIAQSVLAVLATAIMVGACTPARYVKAGVDEAQVAMDLAECQEIAAQQAFRDHAFFESRAEFLALDDFGHRRAVIRSTPGPTLGELEHRYTRICMFSRGYELQPGE